MNIDDQPMPVLELFFSSADPSEEEIDDDDGKKLIWKDILREGQFAITPGRGKRMPFSVVTDGPSSASERIISMADLEAAHAAKAFEHVTIPLKHPDPKQGEDVLNNSGFVPRLRRKVKNGITYLQAGLGFTEPDIAGKVRRGTIPNVSSGIYFNHVRKADGKEFPVALNHVALTANPWINKLEPFKALLASDDNPDPDVEAYQFAEGEEESKTVEIVWDDKDGSKWLTNKLQEVLSPSEAPIEDGRPQSPVASYFVEDVSLTKNLALVQEYFRGVSSRFLIPFSRTEDSVEPAPSVRWTQVREAMIAASDDGTDDPFLLVDKRKKFTEMSADKVREKVQVALSDMLGKDAENYQVAEVALDSRCLIVDKEKLISFAADFGLSKDGVVFLSATSTWERLNNPKESKKDTEKVTETMANPNLTLSFSDTPEGRVAKARYERQLVLSR